MVLVVKNPPANAGDIRNVGLIPGLGRSPGGGNGNPLQYSCLEDPMDTGAWQATAQRAAKSRTWLTRLSTDMHTRLIWLIWMEKRSSLSKFSPFILFQSHSPAVFPSYYTFKIVLVRITSEIHMWSPMGTYPSSSLWYLSVNIIHSLLKYLLSISVIQTLGFPLCHFIGYYFSVLFGSLISYSAMKTWKSQA